MTSHVGLVQIFMRHVTVKAPAAAAHQLRPAASSCPRQLTLHRNEDNLKARLAGSAAQSSLQIAWDQHMFTVGKAT